MRTMKSFKTTKKLLKKVKTPAMLQLTTLNLSSW